MNEVRNIIIGFMLGEEWSDYCYFDRRTGEPVSLFLSDGAGEAHFPTRLAFLPVKEKWYTGSAASFYAESEGGLLIKNLFSVVNGYEEVTLGSFTFSPEDILTAFLREALRAAGIVDPGKSIGCLAVAVDTLTPALVHNLRAAFAALGLRPDNCRIMNRMAAFYGFLKGERGMMRSGNCALLSFSENEVIFEGLTEESEGGVMVSRAVPRRVYEIPVQDAKLYDVTAASFIGQCLDASPFMNVLITGKGYDREIFRKTTAEICRGRKAYLESELFSKGAAWAAFMRIEGTGDDSYFAGPDVVPAEVTMDVLKQGRPAVLSLIPRGSRWYEIEGRERILLDGRETLLFTITRPGGRDRAELPLEGLPKRPDKATFLMLEYKCPDEDTLLITARDLGFGGFYPSSGLSFSMKLDLGAAAPSKEE